MQMIEGTVGSAISPERDREVGTVVREEARGMVMMEVKSDDEKEESATRLCGEPRKRDVHDKGKSRILR